MSMRGLVEVVPGFWVSADQVTAVIAREGLSSRVGPDLLPKRTRGDQWSRFDRLGVQDVGRGTGVCCQDVCCDQREADDMSHAALLGIMVLALVVLLITAVT